MSHIYSECVRANMRIWNFAKLLTPPRSKTHGGLRCCDSQVTQCPLCVFLGIHLPVGVRACSSWTLFSASFRWSSGSPRENLIPLQPPPDRKGQVPLPHFQSEQISTSRLWTVCMRMEIGNGSIHLFVESVSSFESDSSGFFRSWTVCNSSYKG